MSVDFKEKASKAMQKMFLCGAVCAAGTLGAAASMKAFAEDVEKNAPQKFIGPDGHAGLAYSTKQSALVLGGVGSFTLALGAAAFGYYLKREQEQEQEKNQKALQAALLAARQNTK